MTTYAETVNKNDKTGRELKSKITFDGIVYNSSLFYTPVSKDSKEYKYIVSKVSSRKQYDKVKTKFVTCLGITSGDVKRMLDETIVSLYLFVNENGKATSDQASGTLQVVNNSANPTEPSQVWICDLCRHAPDKTQKSAKSPVAPLMHMFEQIAYYAFNKTEIHLMVDKIPKSSEEPFLVGFYRDNYGFSVDDVFDIYDKSHIVMKKTIVPDPDLADFPFAELPKQRSLTKKMHSPDTVLGKKRGLDSLGGRQRKYTRRRK